MAKLTVKDVELKGKKVLVRVDFNVPIKDGVITNDNRITAALPTIKYILEQGGRAVLFSHLGRVKEEADKAGKSLAPVAKALSEKLGHDVVFPGTTRGAELEAAINLKMEKSFSLKTLVLKTSTVKKNLKTTQNLVNTGLHLVTEFSLMTHLVQLTVLTHQTLVSQQMLIKPLLVSFLKTKLLISKKQLKLQNVHS